MEPPRGERPDGAEAGTCQVPQWSHSANAVARHRVVADRVAQELAAIEPRRERRGEGWFNLPTLT